MFKAIPECFIATCRLTCHGKAFGGAASPLMMYKSNSRGAQRHNFTAIKSTWKRKLKLQADTIFRCTRVRNETCSNRDIDPQAYRVNGTREWTLWTVEQWSRHGTGSICLSIYLLYSQTHWECKARLLNLLIGLRKMPQSIEHLQ